MNRLEDIMITLPANIGANADYPELEFVLLDYNSTDGLGRWVKRKMHKHIESGRLVYYRTDDPEFYSMAHSRNVAFRLASGDIVCNLDADNFTFDGTPVSQSWAWWLSSMADSHPERTMFCKTKQLTIMHGRVGFWKDEFVDLLGGYNEQLKGYGFDDQDLAERAIGLGFEPVKWGGSYFYRIQTPSKKKDNNLEESWDKTRRENREVSRANLANGIFRANDGRQWGKAALMKNFTTGVTI